MLRRTRFRSRGAHCALLVAALVYLAAPVADGWLHEHPPEQRAASVVEQGSAPGETAHNAVCNICIAVGAPLLAAPAAAPLAALPIDLLSPVRAAQAGSRLDTSFARARAPPLV